MKMIAPDRMPSWLAGIILLFFVCSLNGQNDKNQVPLFKVNVETVFVKVAVSDSLDRLVTGLNKDNFKIYEDNVQQTISHFSQKSAPISLGIIFDISNSMAGSLILGKSWFTQLLRSGDPNPEDEYFLITFNQKVNLAKVFTSKRAELEYEMYFQKSGGWTALYDAVYRGLDMAKGGKNEKKALILISDGQENRSRYRWTEVSELAKESNVQIYAIGFGSSSVLKDLAILTGGRVFFPNFSYERIDYYFSLIHSELRNQYLLGYISTNSEHNGHWRKIRVELDVPPGLPKVNVRTRDGYYAPRN
jgi:Ca-activated chloride channel family protein